MHTPTYQCARLVPHSCIAVPVDLEKVTVHEWSTFDPTQSKTPYYDSSPISPLAHARVSENKTLGRVVRQPTYPDVATLCSSTVSFADLEKFPPSPSKEYDDSNSNTSLDEMASPADRLKWRLVSGFFACFMGGWAQGGM